MFQNRELVLEFCRPLVLLGSNGLVEFLEQPLAFVLACPVAGPFAGVPSRVMASAVLRAFDHDSGQLFKDVVALRAAHEGRLADLR